MRFGERIVHAWNAFLNRNHTDPHSYDLGSSYSMRPDRSRLHYVNERSLISSIYTRIAIDVSAVGIRHVRLDKNDQYIEDINSGLNECLTVQANKDQEARAFIQDVVMSMFDEGVIAVVPVDTTFDPAVSGSFDVKTMRVGQIVGWHPDHVRVEVYNDQRGMREQIILEKKYTAIVENPLYQVMNEPNSTLQRLIRKLNLLDSADETAHSGKLDLIIQLPYTIRSESRRAQAEQRRKDIEFQLSGSKYGIAYSDGTEKIVQLNRAVENNLLEHVNALTVQLYAQLGLTEAVMNGTADERSMINYYNRTVEPILSAITGAYKRSFLTRTARSKQTIRFFRNPFGLVPVADLAEITDKFTRNEVLTANEIRGIIGIKPSNDPKADELRNSNMPQPSENPTTEVKEQVGQNGS